MRLKTTVLTMLFIYGCGIKITIKPVKVTLPEIDIKLPSIDMSWAEDVQLALEKIEKITAAAHAIDQECGRLDGAPPEQFKACNEASKAGITLYLDMADKKQTIEFLEQSLNKFKLEAQNGSKKQ